MTPLLPLPLLRLSVTLLVATALALGCWFWGRGGGGGGGLEGDWRASLSRRAIAAVTFLASMTVLGFCFSL